MFTDRDRCTGDKGKVAEFTVITEWDKLINRIRLETTQRINGKSGETRSQSIVAIKAVIFVDCNGTPIHWMVESSNVEPASRAKGLIDILT